MRGLAAIVVLGACQEPRAESTPAPSPAPIASLETLRARAHDVLANSCGECHEGHRSTKPAPLAIFDLDVPSWPSRFDAKRFASGLGRLQTKATPDDVATFTAFRDAELAAR